MEHEPQRPENKLLDAHLGRLEEHQRARLDAEYLANPLLNTRNERLGRLLQPLDHWALTPAPTTLADRVLAFVASHAQVKGTTTGAGATIPDRARRLLWSFREPLAVAACLALLFGVGVPSLGRMRDASHRAHCATNLSSIFKGMAAYQEAFAGSLPFAGWMPGSSWLPNDANDRPYLSNSRHVFLLLKGHFGPKSADFLCPGGPDGRPMPCDQLTGQDDFGRACNISYATLNLAGSTPRLRPSRMVAYAGDPNPLFVNARFNAGIDPDRTNSPSHRGRGQTVLTLDGSAAFVTSPICGPKRDNVWLVGNIRHYTGIETPASDDDAQLVQGYPSTDPVISNRGNK